MTSLEHHVVAVDGHLEVNNCGKKFVVFEVSPNYCAGWTRNPAILW